MLLLPPVSSGGADDSTAGPANAREIPSLDINIIDKLGWTFGAVKCQHW